MWRRLPAAAARRARRGPILHRLQPCSDTPVPLYGKWYKLRTNQARVTMSKILIEHADYVVTMDGERRIIRDGAVAMVRSHQRWGRPRQSGIRRCRDHGRSRQAGIAGIVRYPHPRRPAARPRPGDNMYQRFFTHLWKIESEMDEGDALCAFRLCQLELIRAGITCFADPGNRSTSTYSSC